MTPYPPNLSYGTTIERLDPFRLTINEANTPIPRVFFTEITGDFGQRFGRSDTDGYGYAGTPLDGLHNPSTVIPETIFGTHSGKIEKSLIDRVRNKIWGKFRKKAHDPTAHIPVKIVIAAEHCDIFSFEEFPYLIQRYPHSDTQCLGLITAGNDATVIIGKYNDRLILQRGIENPLA